MSNSSALKEHLRLDFDWCWTAVQGSQTCALDNLQSRKCSLIFWNWQVVSCKRTYSNFQAVHMRTHWCTYLCGCCLTRHGWCVLKKNISFRFFVLVLWNITYIHITVSTFCTVNWSTFHFHLLSRATTVYTFDIFDNSGYVTALFNYRGL